MNNLLPTAQTQGNRPINVYEWNSKHVVNWLREHDLQDYSRIFEMQSITGEQLLNTNEEKAIHEFKIEDDEDRKIFMLELEQLKEYHNRGRKINIIEDADKMEKDSSQYLQSINLNPIKVASMQNNFIEGGGDLTDDIDCLMSDSTIQQFEDNDSTMNRKQLEEEIKMIVRMLQQCGGDKMQNSTQFQPQIEASQRYGMTLSKPYVLSQNNLANSTASVQLNAFAASADYQSQLFSESISMSKYKLPNFNELVNINNAEQDERITEALSFQENLSTIPLTHEERIQSIVNQSLIIKDCQDLQQGSKPKFYEFISGEVSIGSDISISLSNSSKRKQGVFKYNTSYKNSKQEFSLNNQQTVYTAPNNSKCNWQFNSINSQSLVTLQVVKRPIALEDTYIIGNHSITVKKMDFQMQNSCMLTLQIKTLGDQICFNNIKVTISEKEIIIGKNRKTCTIYLDNDKEVSSNHCKMVFDSQARCGYIVDNSSTNGTWIQLKPGKMENLNMKMHIQIDVKRDLMIYDCIDHQNLDSIRKLLQTSCTNCGKSNRNARNLTNHKIELCSNCAALKLPSENWAQIIY